MNASNKIHRAVRDVIDLTKSNVAQALLTAVNENRVRGLTADADLEALAAVIGTSIDRSYEQASRSVDRAIAEFVEGPKKKG